MAADETNKAFVKRPIGTSGLNFPQRFLVTWSISAPIIVLFFVAFFGGDLEDFGVLLVGAAFFGTPFAFFAAVIARLLERNGLGAPSGLIASAGFCAVLGLLAFTKGEIVGVSYWVPAVLLYGISWSISYLLTVRRSAVSTTEANDA